MLRSLDSMVGGALVATDGEIGKTLDILFDDRTWAVRYLVVATGSWFRRHKVLVSPVALGQPDRREKTIPLQLTREQVRNSPDIDTDLPVSRQHELAMIRYYRWPDYLGMQPMFPPFPGEGGQAPLSGAAPEEEGDPHLRSAKEVGGYHVNAADGWLGEILDFNIDDEGWRILELVVATELPASGRRLVVPVQSVAAIAWDSRSVRLTGSRADFAPASLATRA